MKYLFKFVAFGFVFMLAACASSHLDPQVANASKNYFPQSITVTESDAFVAGLGSFGGGTTAELASDFSTTVQTDLNKNLRGVMKGKLPAKVSVQLQSIEVGPSTFQSPTTTVRGVVSIVEPNNGATLAQLAFVTDDQAMAAKTNSNPLAALAATAILKAVTATKNVSLMGLALAVSRQVRGQLGGSQLF